MIINYLKNILFTFITIITSCIIITIFNYFNILNNNLLKIISIIIMIFSLLLGGFLTGKKANKKGYLEGLKFGTIIVLIILIFNLLVFKNKFNLINILYYFTLLFSSVIGSMVGILKKN